MNNVKKTLLQIITHHRQNPLDFKNEIIKLVSLMDHITYKIAYFSYIPSAFLQLVANLTVHSPFLVSMGRIYILRK
jgi:hypothetical protein